MKNWNKLRFLVVMLCGVASAQAQTPLTLDEAIKTALVQNNNIQISKNTAQIAENNANRGQAGLLPTVNATGNVDYSVMDNRIQVIGNPEVIENKGAETVNINAAVRGQYTIYSGGANSNRYQQLVVVADLSDAQSRMEVENIVLQVVAAYYNVLRAQNNYEALTQTMNLSKSRYDRASMQQQLSGGSKLNVLNATVDMNKDSVNLLNARQALREAEINLNRVMGTDLYAPVNIDEQNAPEEPLVYETLRGKMIQQNQQLKVVRLGLQSSLLDYKIARSAYMPQLDLDASYSYNRQESEGSFLLFNQNNGFGAGLTLSIPIYTGGVRKTAIQNAQLQVKNNEWQVREMERTLEADLLQAYRDYEIALDIVKMEIENVALNEQNFEYVNKQYELGLVTNTQFREAQINLLLTKNNLNNVTYNLRLAELELLRLSGGLVE